MPARESEFFEALTRSPAGVALLGRLEARQRDDSPWSVPDEVSLTAVDAAVAELETMPFGTFLAVALKAGYGAAGPWSGSAMEELDRAHANAGPRWPIAEAVVRRFSTQLHTVVEAQGQEWWQCGHSRPLDEVMDADFDDVYGNGEFPWAAVRTVTQPPAECHDALLTVWEFDDEPITRWALPIADDRRVYEVHRPEHWVSLVERYPKAARRSHAGWELPGPNQHVPRSASERWGPHVVRHAISRHVLPDWSAVARDFDAVHLSWAGWLTTEGFISDLPSGGVTMLRYWFSDRTFWFRNVFGAPEQLAPPTRDTP